METLKGLDLLNTGTQPLSAEAYSYYINTFANGTGPNGTYVVADFVGTAIGYPAGEYFDQVTEIIIRRASDLATLSEIYSRMVKSCDGTYGTVPTGPIVIPIGPGAGTYADCDTAVSALIALANAEIVSLETTLGDDATAMNTAWTEICNRVVYEVYNLQKCNIDLNQLTTGDIFSALALISSLPQFATDVAQGGAAQFMESIAITTSRAGQAIIGALREGRNNALIDSINLDRDNTIPATPRVPIPRARLRTSFFTAAEARDAIYGQTR